MFHIFCNNLILFLDHLLTYLFNHLLNQLNLFIFNFILLIFKISNHILIFYLQKFLNDFSFLKNNLFNFGFDYFKV